MKIVYGVVEVNGVKYRDQIVLGERKCRVCGNKFEPKRQASLFCSRKCGQAAERKRNADKNSERARKWYADNLERAKERRRNYYWDNPEKFRQATKEWIKNNPEKYEAMRIAYKDKIRHGGKREEIIKQQKGICARCGKNALLAVKDAHVHHVNFDKHDHSEQALVCASCHRKIHLMEHQAR